MKIVIAGASGFIGAKVTAYLRQKGEEVLCLSRSDAQSLHWNPEAGLLDLSVIESSDVVINLCGENIVGRWSDKKRAQAYNSRILPTRCLVSAIQAARKPPKVYLNASAVGYYGEGGQNLLTEKSASGGGELALLCQKWENETAALKPLGIRVLLMRFGTVLGKGGALAKMRQAFNMGLGAKLGSGEQYMSWIAIDDLVQAIYYLISGAGISRADISPADISGPVNFVAPQPIQQKEFAKLLASKLSRPLFLKIPPTMLRWLLKDAADLFLFSQRVCPEKLEKEHYQFVLPDIQQALDKYL